MGRDCCHTYKYSLGNCWRYPGLLQSTNKISIEYFCFYLMFENFLWNHVFVSEHTRHYLLEDFLSSLAWQWTFFLCKLLLIIVGVLTLKIPALLTLPFLPWWLPSANKAQFMKSSSQRNYILPSENNSGFLYESINASWF